mgnify:CR=1 FL=1
MTQKSASSSAKVASAVVSSLELVLLSAVVSAVVSILTGGTVDAAVIMGVVAANAVVTKAVPAGATAVGIPGRIIIKEPAGEQGEQTARRQAMAEKLGFDAYGVTNDMPDPVARAIERMLDHMHAVDKRLEGMCAALSDLGSDYCAKDLPRLDDHDFDVLKGSSQAADGRGSAVDDTQAKP